MSRFVIGIDLGTTNTALAFVDTEVSADNPEEAVVATLPIEQVVAAGAVDSRPTLPSAVYTAAGNEVPAGALNLPWREEAKVTVGTFARELGSRIPTRFIHSSKSWLCHGEIDREAAILPPGTPEADARRSPVDVATLLLGHLAEAWNHTIGGGDPALALTAQEITLCVPASFDAGARNLTVAAAQRAGFTNLHLLEEPQAAFHSWIESTGRDWRKQVRTGDLVLVVDVGGGTTDFSLIGVTEKDGELELRRVAVGEHILLGGDNMDLAIAYRVAQQLETEKGKKLDPWQFAALVQQCRMGKEELLVDATKAAWPIALLGRGTSVIGGTIRTELPRTGLDTSLIEGFFPLVEPTDFPQRARRSGFRAAGLPYAQDPAITRHLAEFLVKNGPSVAELMPDRAPATGQPILPTAVLFNGGVFKADALRERLMAVLAHWAKLAGGEAPRALNHFDLDLAVARGAAYHGLARRGRGVRIRGGSARSYYIQIETPAPAIPGALPPLKAMCIVPYGMEEGTEVRISGTDIDLCIWTGEPASFEFLSSTTRRHDKPGQIVDVASDHLDEFTDHNPIVTTLPSASGSGGEAVEVDLKAHLTEIGVLNLSCIDRRKGTAYLLEFNIRQESGDR